MDPISSAFALAIDIAKQVTGKDSGQAGLFGRASARHRFLFAQAMSGQSS